MFVTILVNDIAVAAAFSFFIGFSHDAPADPRSEARISLDSLCNHDHMTYNKFHDVDFISPMWKVLRYFVSHGFMDVLDGIRCVL